MRRAFLAAALASAACTPLQDPCFTPQSVITDLRVLAVRADPPELLVDLDGGSIPPVDVRVLVVDPLGPSTNGVVSAKLCVPADGGCPADVPGLLAPTNSSGEAHLVVQAAPAMIRASKDVDPLLGFGGIRVQLDVTARSPAGESTARKMMLYTPNAPGLVPNHGLEVSSVKLLFAGDPFAIAGEGGGIVVTTGMTFGVRPVLAPGSIEEYDTTTLDGRQVHLTEHVSYNFYATQHLVLGDPISIGAPIGSANLRGGDVADEPGPGDPEPFNGLVRMQGFRNSAEFLWVVARDGRGGAAWTTVRINQAGQDFSEVSCR